MISRARKHGCPCQCLWRAGDAYEHGSEEGLVKNSNRKCFLSIKGIIFETNKQILNWFSFRGWIITTVVLLVGLPDEAKFLQCLSLHSILQSPLSFVIFFSHIHYFIFPFICAVVAYQPWKFTDIKLATGGLWYCSLNARETYWELKEKLLMKTEWGGYKVQTKCVPYLTRSGCMQNFMKITHKMVYYVLLLQPKALLKYFHSVQNIMDDNDN